jgi:hypothetical protein
MHSHSGHKQCASNVSSKYKKFMEGSLLIKPGSLSHATMLKKIALPNVDSTDILRKYYGVIGKTVQYTKVIETSIIK